MGMLAVPNSAVADPPTLNGTWQISVFQDDGRDRLDRLAAGPAKKGGEPRIAKLVFTADTCYILRGDGRREMASGLTNAGWKSFTLNDSTVPKSIDIVGFSGGESEQTKVYLGIYELEGDNLRICYAETGPGRPTKFESDGNNNLVEAVRISAEPLPVPE